MEIGEEAPGDVSIHLSLQPREGETGRENNPHPPTPNFSSPPPFCSARQERRHSNRSVCCLPLSGEKLVSPKCQSFKSRRGKTCERVVLNF